jgi:hypothetical protein
MHGFISQKTGIFIIPLVRITNIACIHTVKDFGVDVGFLGFDTL